MTNRDRKNLLQNRVSKVRISVCSRDGKDLG